MPSFDVVSKVETHEVDNAIDQTQKELANRYDFRGVEIVLERKENEIKLEAPDDMKLSALKDMLSQRLAKRGLSLKSFVFSDPADAARGYRKHNVEIIQGIKTDEAKRLTKIVKEEKLKKVQVAIQEDQLRVTAPKRDDLQTVMGILKEKAKHELQFVNFRD